MADTIKAKQKLEQLATRIKGRATTYDEDVKMVRAVDAGRIKNREELSRVLAKSLNKTASDVHTTLASDDGDRLADEIVSLLKD